MNGYRIGQHVPLFFFFFFLSIFVNLLLVLFMQSIFASRRLYYFAQWHRFLYLFWLFEALEADIYILDECRHEPAVLVVYPLPVRWVYITPLDLQRYEEDSRFGHQSKNSKNSRLQMALTRYSEIKYQSAIKSRMRRDLGQAL